MGFLTAADPAKPEKPLMISRQALTDLMLADYLKELFGLTEEAHAFPWTRFLTTDPEDLAYRREVLTELSENPGLTADLTAVCKCLQQIQTVQSHPVSEEFYIESIREFSVLSLAHATMQKLSSALHGLSDQKKLSSHGLNRLMEVMDEKLATDFTSDFEERWKDLASGIDQLGSLRLRFTVDGELHIKSAALTHIQKERFVRPGLFSRTLKEDRQSDKPWDLEPVRSMKTPSEELVQVELMGCQKAFLSELGRITQDLSGLLSEMTFYLGGLRFMKVMEKVGVPVSWPQILPMEQKAFSATHMVDPVLAVFKKGEVVANDITFRDHGEILVLTGINQGGKTTFLRTVGAVQLLAQLGWPVPAETAKISPADAIVTVFSHEENTNLQHGKLGQELETIRAGLDKLTPYSLALFNEPITGTSPMENLFLSREVLSSLKVQGGRGIWVTHIYDLASEAEQMNRELPGSTISSIRAVVNRSGSEVSASYRIERGEPLFSSYAKEVLEKETGVL